MEIKTYEHKVQYYETDCMGIVHHSNYIRWFEEARTDFLEQLGIGYDKMEQMGILSPVVSVGCEYKTMAKFGETVKIEAKIKEYNGVSLVLDYIVSDKLTGEVRAVGSSKHCFISRADGAVIVMKRKYPEISKSLKACIEDKGTDK